ncbi:MAG: transposase [Bryobacteraceae bacterium]
MLKSNLKQLQPRQAESAAPQRKEGERSEPDRSGGAADSGGAAPAPIPDPEVPANPKRRQFTAEYKRCILDQAEACRDEGAIGALLRREGLYSSHLTAWRRQRQQGELAALSPKKRGRKSTAHPLAEENQRLRNENARLSRRLEQAELIIDVQKKVSALLGISLPEVHNGGGN